MICERCNGDGTVELIPGYMIYVPCPECNGSGRQSCCQGHEGQPEEADE